MFACRSVCQENALFLRADLDEVCWKDRHLHYALGVGLPMLLVYVVGLPLAAWLRVRVMQRNADMQQKTLGDAESLGVLEDRKLCIFVVFGSGSGFVYLVQVAWYKFMCGCLKHSFCLFSCVR